MRSFLLASALLVGSTVTLLVGCGGGSGGSGADAQDNPFAPPAGCTRTQCDVEHDSCGSDQASQCSQCESLCENPYADPSCFDTCADICDDTSRAANCADEYTSCQQTQENTECVAGAASAIDAGGATFATDARPPADGGAHISADAASWLYCGNPQLGAFPPVAPNASPQSACTADEIDSIADAIDLDASTLVAIVGSTSASCQKCALSRAQDPSWGPLVNISGEEVMLNQGACVAQTDSTCAAEVNQLFFCVQEACSTCTDDDSDETCANAAQTDVCAAYALDDACTTEATSGASSSCFPSAGSSDTGLAAYVLTLQCGSM